MKQVRSDRFWIQVGGELPPLNEVAAFVKRHHCGAVNLFEGVTRNHEKGKDVLSLFYDCYEEMAVKQLENLGDEIDAEYPLGAIAVLHRIGEVPVGETSMIVAISSPHRREAVDATLLLIERLKEEVPIWKKEQFADESLWKEEQTDAAKVAGSSTQE